MKDEINCSKVRGIGGGYSTPGSGGGAPIGSSGGYSEWPDMGLLPGISGGYSDIKWYSEERGI